MGSTQTRPPSADTALRESTRTHRPTWRAQEGSNCPKKLVLRVSGKAPSTSSGSSSSSSSAGKKDSKQRALFKFPAWAWEAAAARSAVESWKKEKELGVSSVLTDHGSHKNKQLREEHCSECLLQKHGGERLEAASLLMGLRHAK
jgi:hypothetical protein